jgi:putative flippase GtrA
MLRSRVSSSPSAPSRKLVGFYVRSQLVAVLATAVDFGVMVTITKLWAGHYVAATAIGAVSGGVMAFVANRNWSFLARDRAALGQSLRYAVVWVGSLSLNVGLVYVLTEAGGINAVVSKVITSILVGVFFNFPLHRYFVFR